MTQVFPGQILGGKYRVDRVLGAGGMGMVVSATHLHLEERVAIKFLLPEALQSPEAVARFGREARAAVKIRGEHVARVIDVGAFENGAPYMVMEHLDGRDLAALLVERGPLAPSDAVDAVLQACEALAEAHALGIVHRDLKPANLFLTRRPDGTPSVKVLDFGISKVTSAASSENSMTRTSAVMGSPLYMSPEQMTASRDVDARADIWAIGVVLYELLTGRTPFRADSLPEICALILTAAPPAIRDYSPGTPEGLQAAVVRCLEKDRTRRFQSVADLARALAPYGSRATSRSLERIARILGGDSQSYDAPASSAQPLAAQAGTQFNWGQTKAPRSSTLSIMAAAAATVVLLGGLTGLLVWRAKAPELAAAAKPSVPTPTLSAAQTVSQPALAVVLVAPGAGGVSAATAALHAAPPSSSKPVVAQAKAVAAKAPVNSRPASATAPAAAAKPKKSAEEMMSGRD